MTSATNPPYDGSGEPVSDTERRLEERYARELPPSESAAKISALHQYCKAIRKVPAGFLCFQSLDREIHLSDREKEIVLNRAVSHYVRNELKKSAPRPFASLSWAWAAYPGKGTKIQPPGRELARFIDFDFFLEQYLPTDEPSAMNRSYLTDGSGEILLKRLLGDPRAVTDSKLVTDPNLLQSLYGWIRGEDVYVFSTLADWVDQQAKSGPVLANWVRDKLGLPHLAKKKVLEIRIPISVAKKGGPLRKPTVSDSRGYPPFLPSQPDDAFGYARDLFGGTLDSRGGPEVYHAALLTKEISGLRYLGGPIDDLEGMWKAYNDARPLL